ncbi:MAG: class I SAM-dependent methyltransferase [Candidatus Peregrinibacteria bacterium]|nr:class I SAM-dependent methyltransferase [Candidatus Peregrinibacteria bacterium]
MKSEYDEFAKDFSQTRKNPWPEFETFLPFINRDDRILDLGCGNGRFRQVLEKGLIPEGNYFGMDISGGLLEIARKNYPKDHFFRGAFEQRFPFGNNNFEVVSGIASFHHCLSVQEQMNFLNESWRVLKPGGKLCLTTWILPKKFFWSNFWKGRVFTKNWIIPFGKEKLPRTYRNVSDNDLKNLFKKSGFEILKLEKFKGRNLVVVAEKQPIK